MTPFSYPSGWISYSASSKRSRDGGGGGHRGSCWGHLQAVSIIQSTDTYSDIHHRVRPGNGKATGHRFALGLVGHEYRVYLHRPARPANESTASRGAQEEKGGPCTSLWCKRGTKKQAKGWEGTQKVMHYRPNTDAVMTGLGETPFFSFILFFSFLFFQLSCFFLFLFFSFSITREKLYITSRKEETDGGMGGIRWSLVVGS